MIPQTNDSEHLYFPTLEELNEPLLVDNNLESDEDEINQLRPNSFMSLLMTSPTQCFHYYWRKFDDCFMRPIFGGSESSLEYLSP